MEKFVKMTYTLLACNDLTSNQKLIIALIRGVKRCFFKNEYFCKHLNISERQLQKELKALKDKGYIDTAIQSNNRREIWLLNKAYIVIMGW